MLNIELSYDSAIPLLGVYSTEVKIYIYTKMFIQIFKEILLIIVKR